MAEPFRKAESRTADAGRRWRTRRSAALEQIEDLLARADGVRSVTLEHVASVCAEHGLESPRRIPRDRRRLYSCYLKHCFEDGRLSEEESADLAHLRELLHLEPAELARIHEEVAREVYGSAVEDALDDLRLDEDEAAFLQRLRSDLALSERDAARLLDRGAFEARARAMSRATARDKEILERQAPAGEFVGRSPESLEAAVADALSKAAVVVPGLHWFEVSEISGYVEDGQASGWHVQIRAGIRR